MKRADEVRDEAQLAKESRRRFLKKTGTIVVAAPVMESLSREGLLVRSAHAQTLPAGAFNGPMSGPINEPS